MKRIAIFLGMSLFVLVPSWLVGQEPPPPPPPQYQTQPPPPPPSQYRPPAQSAYEDHGEAGVFADYLRFAPTDRITNYVGAGGRIAINMNPHVGLEAEMSYDFARNYTSTYSNGVTSTFVTSSVRPLTGLFGPKFQFGTSQPVRAFLTGKIGFVDFSVNHSGVVNGSGFTNAVAGVGNGGTYFAAYPGGGIETFIGPVGLRLEAGDEIYFNNGSYNNLRVTFGPEIRF